MIKKLTLCLLILAFVLAGCSRVDPAPETGTHIPLPTLTTGPNATESVDTDENIPVQTTEAPVTEVLTAETETMPKGEPGPEETELLVENSAFSKLAGPNCDPSIIAVLYNAPFVDGAPELSATWNEGEFDQLAICPRYVGSMIDVWRIHRENPEDGEQGSLEGPVYTAICAEGDCYGAALERPEGAALWAISVTVPETADTYLELNYNGRYGTPAFEYLTDNNSVIYAASQSIDPMIAGELSAFIGPDAFGAFLRASFRAGMDPWAAMGRYCSPLNEFGDGAAYTVCQGEMEGDTCHMETARLREGYDPGDHVSVAERAEAQARRYAEIGNRDGILGIDPYQNEALYFDLKGLTVYNPTLLAQEVSVKVNGEDAGTFPLTEGDFVTLLDLGMEKLPADTAVRVEVRVTRSRGAADAAILELWPGLGGNISGAR